MIEMAPVSESEMTYDEAILYCQFCDYHGHRDWRLPTWAEYRPNPAIYGWYVDPSEPYEFTFHVHPVRNV